VTRLLLLEHVPATFRPEPGETVVALTPEACYDLDRRRVPYMLTTDFGVDAELAALEPRHWQEQLGWIASLDEAIAGEVAATRRWRFGAATLYAFDLKRTMDPLRVQAVELGSMLDACDHITLHRRAEADSPGPFHLAFRGRNARSRLLPLVAGVRGIAFEERVDDEGPAPVTPVLETRATTESSAWAVRVRRRLAARLRESHGRVRGARSTQAGANASGDLTLLFADSGYDLEPLLTRARTHGHRCLRVRGDTVIEEGEGRTEVARLPTEGADSDWDSAAETIASSGHGLWNWPNEWLPGVPLADILRPRIVAWLREVMPRVAARAAALEELLRSERVDVVLGANIANLDVVTAAAVTARPTQSVLIDHGHDAFEQELFDLIALRYADHDFTPTSEFARYLRSRAPLCDYPTAEVQVGSYQWRSNAAPTRAEQPPYPLPGDRPTVVYALTSTAGDARYLNSAFYADGWYYHLCREIVDVLARHPEVFSIVKLFPGDGNVRNPIDLYVDDLGLDHLVSSRVPLRTWIPWADRIVFDLPSTGMYEAAAAGTPYLALLYSGHRHRPEAVDLLGPAAVQFTEPAEAAHAVDAFVGAETVTAPKLVPEGEEILTTLERLVRY
jgi:hypothetical protein